MTWCECGQTVRKHRAPKGALRQLELGQGHGRDAGVRKHRAPKGALRLKGHLRVVLAFFHVRKHRAPKGALRRAAGRCEAMLHDVRKHRAPKGALRRDEPRRAVLHEVAGQKAPSAKRCIKTDGSTC